MSTDSDDDLLRDEISHFEAAAQSHVPALHERLLHLCKHSDRITIGVEVNETDHLGFMSLFFNAKQLQHAESLLLLGSHADCSLVARSMLEGLCLLKWATQEPDRALRWRMFSAVLDWRTAKRFLADGVAVTEQRQADIAAKLAQLGDDFLTEKTKEARARNKPDPADPWVARWYQPQLRQIFQAVGAEALYDGPYFMMSEWHHWSPGGLAQGIRLKGDTLRFEPRSFAVQSGALRSAFQCVAETSGLVAAHFDLKDAATLAGIIQAYVADRTING